MDRRSFLVISASASAIALAGSGAPAALARPLVRSSHVVRADRQWMAPAGHACSGSRGKLRFAGSNREALLSLMPLPRG